jgi:hypothetical protein
METGQPQKESNVYWRHGTRALPASHPISSGEVVAQVTRDRKPGIVHGATGELGYNSVENIVSRQ